MPLEQTITVGKQLLSIFKEAKGAYHDKKSELRERAGLRRSQTFDHTRGVGRHDECKYDGQNCEAQNGDAFEYRHGCRYRAEYDGLAADGHGRRRSCDFYSEASVRTSVRSTRSRHGEDGRAGTRTRPALTERNLKTLSEVSSTTPSGPRQPATAHRSPYAETLPRGKALSKLDLNAAEHRAAADESRRMSEPRTATDRSGGGKEIDMHLAYGNIPPDLADRVDLDPELGDEFRARQLVRQVEGLLDEAHCLQHSATAIIKHLQEKPDAAAAVALTLAELSTTVAKMSPAFLGFIKGGSPAVFALLASPQFLIGTGIAVGVTVVMFGGWKIVKKVREAQQAAAPPEATALEGAPAATDRRRPLGRARSEYSAGIDEALVVDDELSTIESWRRGIMPSGADDESAELELMTPEVERAYRAKHARDDVEFDLKSRRSGRTMRTSRTERPSAGKEKDKERAKERAKAKDKGKDKEGARQRERERERDKDKSNGKTKSKRVAVPATAESVSGHSERSRKSSSTSTGSKSKSRPTVRAIEDGASRRGDPRMDVIFLPKLRQDNMLKAIFRKKEKERVNRGELVLA
ncbi:hypothetical protein DCS_02231 [Drechmeria coniospora]|uniref:Uncharacterized protein n=1 Tax=Drechmeria coniospora TaxID=98403 RepID=A0A151GVJ3_DRECN|nr:hypothetical protein DCS_02231 [Drechmeria coniospora]KYK61090.1 hypothetical protein DCS_02231 [Drechmeria coniospora]